MNDETFVQCICGNQWSMDCDPTPKLCEDDPWRLKIGTEDSWGPWINHEGDPWLEEK